jgi:distribution and morphology protein 12
MSIDLSWAKLDSTLSDILVEALNKQLSTTEKPSFIGPIEVISLEFGTACPDIELVDLRDIYRDFLEDEDAEQTGDSKDALAGAVAGEDDFEWVSRRAARREEGLAYFQQPGYMFASTPTLHSPVMDTPSLVDYRPLYASWSSPGAPPFRQPVLSNITVPQPSSPLPEASASDPPPPPPPPNNYPNLQVHLHINWNSDLRITLTTSLLINYPSPMFMSLPIKLSITGLVFCGEVAVAYQGERSRVHICILDDLDPYGPATKRDTQTHTQSPSPTSTPPGDEPRPHTSKPLPIGHRLLPSIFIESEIGNITGDSDKHVLKNVNRVERFIQDVIRKAVEEELVFPNFHTVVLGGTTNQG